ncbi:MAG: hypothetical protein AAF208_07225 [Cyanobacteria bacterium P01_A01_bin.45]
MNKKRKISYLSLLFLLVGCFSVILPTKSNAGKTVVNGTSIDSSSFSGDSFTPNSNNTIPTPAPDTNAFVETSGNIVLSPLAQQKLNRIAELILNNRSSFKNIGSVSKTLVAILTKSGGNLNNSQFTSSLQNLGVPRVLVNSLIRELSGLIQKSDFKSVKDTEQSKDLSEKASVLGQESTVYVDINRLNAAIVAYNKIVLKSDLKTLKKLSKNSDFLAVNQILKELRTSVNEVK